MPEFLTIHDLACKSKVVLLRADLNVPVQDGRVTDTTRIERLLPTLDLLCRKGARIVVLSHFGRPKGKDPLLSLAPIGKQLAALFKKPVGFVNDCIGSVVENTIAAMKDGDIVLLENVRFYPEEEKNDPDFAKKIAVLGQAYVNDAFSCAHRAHATTTGIAEFLPSYAGLLMEEELKALGMALEHPKPPVMAIVGGAKISTKLDLLNNLVNKMDVLVLGGGMANTFLAATGTPVGKSLCEREMKTQALAVMEAAKKRPCRIILPVDGVVAQEFKEGAASKTVDIRSIGDADMVLDIGEKTAALIKDELEQAGTILWNGPLGAFETKPFDQGTKAIAKAVADLTTQKKTISVAGGGDTVSALAATGVEEKMTYVSAAGGAFLEWLEGKSLPGVKALEDHARRHKKAG